MPLVVVGLIIFFSVVISGGTMPNPSKFADSVQPTGDPHVIIADNSSHGNQKSLQMHSFTFVTVTPPAATPTPTSAPPTVINFTAGYDYEDLAATITDICHYPNIPANVAYCPAFSWKCPTLSPVCVGQLNQAITTEIGPIGQGLPGIPGSRVNLCLQDLSCKTNGYDHYTGNIPLPVAPISDSCKNEFSVCYSKSPLVTGDLYKTYPNVRDIAARTLQDQQYRNCDVTDDICTVQNAH